MEELIRVLKELRPDIDFENQTSLIDDGVLDSFDIVSIISELNSTFDISIGIDDLTPENFNNVAAMWALIERLCAEQ